jgi:hypothetical protein
MGLEVETVFGEVLLICYEMRLLGGKMFAIDSCRLPLNAAKEWSEMKKKRQRLRKAAKRERKV